MASPADRPESSRSSSDPLEVSTLRPTSVLSDEISVRIFAFTVIFHPRLERIGERTPLAALSSGRQVSLSRLEPAFAPVGGNVARPLADPHLSRRPIWLRPVDDSIEIQKSDKALSIRVNDEPLGERRLLSAAEVCRGVVLEIADCVVLLLHKLEPRSEDARPDFDLVGTSSAMSHLRRQIHRAAEHDAPVLLRGETGTGKELVARAIHLAGRRRQRPYVTMNIGAVQPSLAAAELFGASRGAYTGADRERKGFFRRADGGTLFLDEIGEVPLEIQPLLLRVLENGEVQPVGAAATHRVSVRLIAATDADLERKIAEGRFRAPLLHRLAGAVIRVPALRQRRADIGLLLCHFLERELRHLGHPDSFLTDEPRRRAWLPARTLARLAGFDWPGNVRQLRNVARQLAILSRHGTAREAEELLDEWIGPSSGGQSTTLTTTARRPSQQTRKPPPAHYRQAHEISEDELKNALMANEFRLKPTAKHLGVSRTVLYSMIDRSQGIRRASQIEREELIACSRRHSGNLEAMAAELEISRYGLQRRLRELRISATSENS